MGYVIDCEHRITYPGDSLYVHDDIGLQTSETFPREILNQTMCNSNHLMTQQKTNRKMHNSNQPNETTDNKPNHVQQQSA